MKENAYRYSRLYAFYFVTPSSELPLTFAGDALVLGRRRGA